MSKHPEFLGTIPHNKIDSILPRIKPRSRGCFIINTDSASERGMHWQAVFYDARPVVGSNSIEFFDSFGDDADPVIMRGLNKVSALLELPTLIKFKQNKIVLQKDSSDNCGYFCCQFLQDRLAGHNFKECTKFDDTKRGEASIENWKTFKQRGSGFLDKIKSGFSAVKNKLSGLTTDIGNRVVGFVQGPREHAPPSVRTWLAKHGDLPILRIYAVKKPIDSYIEKIASWLSSGKFDQNKRDLNIDKMMHLYLIVETEGGPIIRIDKSEVWAIRETMVANAEHRTNGASIIPVSLNGKTITANEMFNAGEKLDGMNKFWVYHPITANCQLGLKALLKGVGLWTPELETFTIQNAAGVIRGIEGLGDKAAGITDFAGRIDILLNGRGKRIIKK